jgi:hypothetical protein
MVRVLRTAGIVLAVLCASGVTAAQPLADAAPPFGFSPPVFVDRGLAGGEPLVMETKYGTLLYTSHEGTTHLEREGFAGAQSVVEFARGYRNQVNNWISEDGGRTWKLVSLMGTGLTQLPVYNTGFSDPDLTADEGGRIYNTGINLVNDALFSTGDGGRTFDKGTFQCASGDRPWLAGGKPNHVFMSTNVTASPRRSILGHEVFHSGTAGASCDAPVPDSGGLVGGGIVANGRTATRKWTGNGKLYYDHTDGSLVEPAVFQPISGSKPLGLGVDYLANAQAAFPADGTKAFTPIEVVPNTTAFSHWPAMAIDQAQNVYLVWDTDDRSKTESKGCGGQPSPLSNRVMMVVGTHVGPQAWKWSAPIAVAAPANGRVLWPWIAAGSPGNVSVVWYEYDKVVDPDCATEGNIRIYDAHVFGALGPSPTIQTVNAGGRAIASRGICQGGTGCVASGKDRRLGDFFTNELDSKGCVMIASGDTSVPDPITKKDQVVSHPIFMRQTSGRSLTGGTCGPGRLLAKRR